MPPKSRTYHALPTTVYECTSGQCGIKIKSTLDARLHQLLGVLVCNKCYNDYGDGDFAANFEEGVDEVGDDNFCRWCVDGGDLFGCGGEKDSGRCHYSFCRVCLEKNNPGDPILKKKNESNIAWYCYACRPEVLREMRNQARAAMKDLNEREYAENKDKFSQPKTKKLKTSVESVIDNVTTTEKAAPSEKPTIPVKPTVSERATRSEKATIPEKVVISEKTKTHPEKAIIPEKATPSEKPTQSDKASGLNKTALLEKNTSLPEKETLSVKKATPPPKEVEKEKSREQMVASVIGIKNHMNNSIKKTKVFDEQPQAAQDIFTPLPSVTMTPQKVIPAKKRELINRVEGYRKSGELCIREVVTKFDIILDMFATREANDHKRRKQINQEIESLNTPLSEFQTFIRELRKLNQ